MQLEANRKGDFPLVITETKAFRLVQDPDCSRRSITYALAIRIIAGSKYDLHPIPKKCFDGKSEEADFVVGVISIVVFDTRELFPKGIAGLYLYST